MPGATDKTLNRNVVCPFCGLACDDLTVAVERGRVAVGEAGCALSRQSFERTVPDSSPMLAGTPAHQERATARAAEILLKSRLPLFAGLATDVAGLRATLRLAERTGGTVDHLAADGLFRNLRVLQDSGWMTTTLSEVRNHADVLLAIGPDPATAFPRFFERCAERRQTLYEEGAKAPETLRLGPDGDFHCAIGRLPEAVTALRCLVGKRRLQRDDPGGIPAAQLGRLADRLITAKYAVIVWTAAAFEPSGAELLVHALVDLVRDVNLVTRCAGLPLTGTDNLVGANQVCGWQTGLPLRTSFAGGAPDHDPLLNATTRILDAQEADALVWISAFRPMPPPSTIVPTIVLSAPEPRFERAPDVFIPVATPGLDHAGDLFRADGVVSLRLAALRPSRLPSVATVLERIEAAFEDASA